jgi:glycosyltransferase involved in cell wall biosynthesis
MSSQPLLSVCMPVYNAEQYVRLATQSILDQTFRDFEFIIIDDGSTDTSHEILEEFAAKDTRIRLISRPNTGYTVALNEAVALAKAPFLARMDADDISMPDRFEKQISYLEAHPECVLVGSRILTIDPFGSPLYEPAHKLVHDDIERQLLSGVGWAIVHPVSMMLRSAILELGGYRVEMEPAEDLDLFLRLAERGKIANLPQILLHYRQHIKSVNHTRYEEQNRATRVIVAEAYARRGIELPHDWKPPPERQILPMEKEIDMWAWVALKNGNVSAARKHALSMFRLAPFSMNTWRLLYCALRGR